MTAAKRSVALTLALVILLLPMAFAQCRDACMRAAAPAPAASAAHACHETADAASGATLSPSPRACGHSDEARRADATAIAAASVRHDIALVLPPVTVTADMRPFTVTPDSLPPPRPSRARIPGILSLRV